MLVNTCWKHITRHRAVTSTLCKIAKFANSVNPRFVKIRRSTVKLFLLPATTFARLASLSVPAGCRHAYCGSLAARSIFQWCIIAARQALHAFEQKPVPERGAYLWGRLEQASAIQRSSLESVLTRRQIRIRLRPEGTDPCWYADQNSPPNLRLCIWILSATSGDVALIALGWRCSLASWNWSGMSFSKFISLMTCRCERCTLVTPSQRYQSRFLQPTLRVGLTQWQGTCNDYSNHIFLIKYMLRVGFWLMSRAWGKWLWWSLLQGTLPRYQP